MTTFADLGIPFPLFDAPVEEAYNFIGSGTCSLCGQHSEHRFEVYIGADVIVECSKCGAQNGLDAYTCKSAPCSCCQHRIEWPLPPGSEIVTCYPCLRSGRAAFTQDTELGMVTWEHARSGVTHGAPDLTHPDFEIVPGESGWNGTRVPSELLLELTRTPNYSTIQGECWQFCCGTPMVYQGSWSRDEFRRRAPDGNAEAYFNAIVQDVIPGLWTDQLHDDTGIYAFQCKCCRRLTAHWDLA